MKKIIALTVFAAPALAFAQRITNADTLLQRITDLLNKAIPVIIALAVVYLIYAIFIYVIAGDEGKKEKARDLIGWGILGLFVMLSIWGLVRILINTTGLENHKLQPSEIPSVIYR